MTSRNDMGIVIFSLYMILGALLVSFSAHRIRPYVPEPESLLDFVQTAVCWALTWPLWAFRR